LLPKLHIYPVFKVVSLFIGFLSYWKLYGF
jgi:hypothetical protein